MIFRKQMGLVESRFKLQSNKHGLYGFIGENFVSVTLRGFTHRLEVLVPKLGDARKEDLLNWKKSLLITELQVKNPWVVVLFDEKIPSWRFEKIIKLLNYFESHKASQVGRPVCANCHENKPLEVFCYQNRLVPLCQDCSATITQDLINAQMEFDGRKTNLKTAIPISFFFSFLSGLLVCFLSELIDPTILLALIVLLFVTDWSYLKFGGKLNRASMLIVTVLFLASSLLSVLFWDIVATSIHQGSKVGDFIKNLGLKLVPLFVSANVMLGFIYVRTRWNVEKVPQLKRIGSSGIRT